MVVGGPLQGVRILDLTSVVMGPFATQFLGDLGADIIKVESPEGDVVRQIGPMRNPGMGPVFLNANRNKRSIVLDLKSEKGREAVLRLAKDVDVLIYNIRPQAMQRLKLGYEDVRAVNPRIVYAGLLGFAQNGPYSGRPAYDDLIQGASLIPFLAARSSGEQPRYAPNALADRVVGLSAAVAIVSCLVHRNRTNHGQSIEIPMFETMVNFILADHFGGLTFEPPLDGGGYARQLARERRPYRTKDGFICAVIFTSPQWRRFFDLVGRSDLKSDARFADIASRTRNVDALYSEIDHIFGERTTEEWLLLLEREDIPAMRMHDFESLFQDEHLVATDFFSTVEHPTEGTLRVTRVAANWSEGELASSRHAPALGEHSYEILREAGYDAGEIHELAEQGVTKLG